MSRSRALVVAAFVGLGATALVFGRPDDAQPQAAKKAAEAKVDFTRDVRPILAANCFACHGQDAKQRKKNLRLDTRAGATAELDDLTHAVVPGKPDDSEMLSRLTATEASQKMPPPKTGKALTPAQIALLRKWIEQGANYSVHWAFVKPQKTAPPQV